MTPRVNAAIVVGCSRYEDDDIAPLRYAARDATNVAAALRATCGVPEQNLVLLHDDAAAPHLRPTRSNILRQVLRLAADLDNAGILFFFFSGHGFQSRSDEQYLLPIDCLAGAIAETALPFSTLVSHLGRANAPHTVLMLDACRNAVDGGKSITADPGRRVNVEALCPPGVVSLCSCQPGRVSYEAEALQSGIFSAALCDALGGVGHCRTIHELDTYLTRRVAELALTHGKPRQIPFSRVEPLSVQHLRIAAEPENRWQGLAGLGREVRRRVVPRLAAPPTRGVFAIDYGTSASLIGCLDGNGEPVVIPGQDGRPLVPSVVHFLPGFDFLVGSAAVEVESLRPGSTIRHSKRALGTTASYEIDGRVITPELAASLVIASLCQNAQEATGLPVRECVASYPANFSRPQLAALQRAFELAGVHVIRFLGEPSLAGMVLGCGPGGASWEGSALVVDLGGGTFDAALVDLDGGAVVVNSLAGSNAVGGLDFDAALAAYARESLVEQGFRGAFTAEIEALVRREAERAKRELTRAEHATLLLTDLPGSAGELTDYSVSIDRPTFRRITADLNRQIRRVLDTVLRAYSEPIEMIMLAGLGSKIFTIGETLADLGLNAVINTEYADYAVIRGGVLHAGLLHGQVRDVLLLNVLHHDIAIRCQYAGGSGTDLDLPILAADPAHNTELCVLERAQSFYPTLQTELFRLAGGAGQPHPVELVQVLDDGETYLIAREEVTAEDYLWSLGVEVDADGRIRIVTQAPR